MEIIRKAKIFSHRVFAGYLYERKDHSFYFEYNENYLGPPVSLTMPRNQKTFEYSTFPPFFEGLLPEGKRLERLLKTYKIDRTDCFSILLLTGSDLVGAITVERDNV